MRRKILIHIIRQSSGRSPAPAPAPAPAVAPTITSSASVSVAENQTGAGTTTATGTGTLVYSIIGGADAALFNIDSSTGVRTFVDAPNFDVPGSDAGSNAYSLVIQVAGDTSPAATQNLTVNVTDVADIVPVVTASQSFSVVENAADNAVVGTVLVTAGDTATDNFEITSGNTGAAFAISSAGVITKIEDLDYGTLSSYTLATRAHSAAGWGASENVGITVTEAVVWPVAASVTPNVATSGTDMTLPTNSTPVADARWPVTNLKRISFVGDFPTPTSGPDWNNFGPVYAAQQSWNLDGTKLLISALVLNSTGGLLSTYYRTNLFLFTGDGTYIKPCVQPGVGEAPDDGLPINAKWSNSDADEVLFVYGYDDVPAYNDVTAIWRWRPSTELFSIVKSFGPTYDLISNSWSGGVNDPSIDGRYFLLGLRKPGGQWYAVCWDRVADTIECEIPLPEEPGAGASVIPQIEMSRSGEFLTIMALAGWTEGATSRAIGLSIYERDGTFLRTFYHGPGTGIGDQTGATRINGHSGNAQDVNGEDVYLFLYSDDGNYESRRIKSIRLDGSQSMPGRDECDNGIFMGLHYIEAFSYAAPGWALVSDLSVYTGNAGYNAFPMRGHIWAIKLDGSKTIYPIAQARAHVAAADFANNDVYYYYPWATPNRDMTKVLFKSTFNTDWSAGGNGFPTECHAIIASPS